MDGPAGHAHLDKPTGDGDTLLEGNEADGVHTHVQNLGHGGVEARGSGVEGHGLRDHAQLGKVVGQQPGQRGAVIVGPIGDSHAGSPTGGDAVGHHLGLAHCDGDRTEIEVGVGLGRERRRRVGRGALRDLGIGQGLDERLRHP